MSRPLPGPTEGEEAFGGAGSGLTDKGMAEVTAGGTDCWTVLAEPQPHGSGSGYCIQADAPISVLGFLSPPQMPLGR